MARSFALLVLVAAIALVVVAPRAEGAISCGTVISKLTPCMPYAQGKVPTIPPSCCSGVKSLKGLASTPADRQAACTCLKSVAGKATGLKPGLYQGIPGKCGVSVGYPISASVDCSQVH